MPTGRVSKQGKPPLIILLSSASARAEMQAPNQQTAKSQVPDKRNKSRRKPSKSSSGQSLIEMLTSRSKCLHDPAMACSQSGPAPPGGAGGELKTVATESS